MIRILDARRELMTDSCSHLNRVSKSVGVLTGCVCPSVWHDDWNAYDIGGGTGLRGERGSVGGSLSLFFRLGVTFTANTDVTDDEKCWNRARKEDIKVVDVVSSRERR